MESDPWDGRDGRVVNQREDVEKVPTEGERCGRRGLERPLTAKQARLSSPQLKNQQPRASEGGAAKQWCVPCGRRRARLMQNLCWLHVILGIFPQV